MAMASEKQAVIGLCAYLLVDGVNEISSQSVYKTSCTFIRGMSTSISIWRGRVSWTQSRDLGRVLTMFCPFLSSPFAALPSLRSPEIISG